MDGAAQIGAPWFGRWLPRLRHRRDAQQIGWIDRPLSMSAASGASLWRNRRNLIGVEAGEDRFLVHRETRYSH